mmetsp:Transcript_62153/g.148087  ORF Transcript_62153/g.148087 Transcript_62153/m.148087 type:complete len:253 (-) Transcript_62153:420-1178(-)
MLAPPASPPALPLEPLGRRCCVPFDSRIHHPVLVRKGPQHELDPRGARDEEQAVSWVVYGWPDRGAHRALPGRRERSAALKRDSNGGSGRGVGEAGERAPDVRAVKRPLRHEDGAPHPLEQVRWQQPLPRLRRRPPLGARGVERRRGAPERFSIRVRREHPRFKPCYAGGDHRPVYRTHRVPLESHLIEASGNVVECQQHGHPPATTPSDQHPLRLCQLLQSKKIVKKGVERLPPAKIDTPLEHLGPVACEG